MVNNCDSVIVKCLACNVEHDNVIKYGLNTKYPDDFYIECKHCSNWEEGALPTQTFRILATK